MAQLGHWDCTLENVAGALTSGCTKASMGCLQDFKTVLLLNCGATEDVEDLFNVTEITRIIVVDSHRYLNTAYSEKLALFLAKL